MKKLILALAIVFITGCSGYGYWLKDDVKISEAEHQYEYMYLHDNG